MGMISICDLKKKNLNITHYFVMHVTKSGASCIVVKPIVVRSYFAYFLVFAGFQTGGLGLLNTAIPPIISAHYVSQLQHPKKVMVRQRKMLSAEVIYLS